MELETGEWLVLGEEAMLIGIDEDESDSGPAADEIDVFGDIR